ncbi:transporter [Natrarchaeobius chitinivorans]|uniref:Transporter n=2 Tax=Natrarchaeobius chitinivorans TaxID=1679083 RepID=A0A3N6M7K5_NATCH|nr:transporter [Natrarchaeobius chitinivorans]
MRLGQTSFILFLSKIFGSFLGFVATIYFARVLGEEVLGQYALVLTIVAWVGIVSSVGFSGAIEKRISEGDEPDRYLGAGIVITGGILILATVFVLLFRSQINAYVGVPVAEFVLLLLFASKLKALVNASLKGTHLVHVYAVLWSGKLLTRATAQIALVAIGFGLTGMLYGYAIASLVTATVGIWVLGLRPARPTTKHVRSLFDYAKYNWLGGMQGKTFDSVDIAVLGFFVTQGLVGIYSVAWSLGKFLDVFGRSISSTLFPEMSELSSANDMKAVATLTEDALSYGGLILIPGLVGSLVIGDRLLAIYGDGFVAGTEVLVILIAALLIYTYNKQLLNTLNAIDRPNLAFKANGVFIVSNISLNVVLVWQIGWVGAAIATAASAAVSLCLAFRYSKRVVPFEIPVRECSYQWIAALLMGAVVELSREFGERNWGWVQDYNVVFVVMLVTIGAGIYFATYFAVSQSFRTTVTNNLPIEVPLVSER